MSQDYHFYFVLLSDNSMLWFIPRYHPLSQQHRLLMRFSSGTGRIESLFFIVVVVVMKKRLKGSSFVSYAVGWAGSACLSSVQPASVCDVFLCTCFKASCRKEEEGMEDSQMLSRFVEKC